MKPVLVWGAVGAAFVVLAGFVATEDRRTQRAVYFAVFDAKREIDQARKDAEQAKRAAEVEKREAVRAAVAKAVADTEKKVLAAQPKLPKIETKLLADPETLALFPKGAFLMEVGDNWKTATCEDRKQNVHWVRLYTEPYLRSTMERYEVSAMRFIVGILAFPVSAINAYFGPGTPQQTIFIASTKGKYTTLMLGALRSSSDPDYVSPQVRITLYRIDHSNFGLVERVPMDEPPAARPEDKAPRYTQVLRRCVYQQGGAKDL